MDRLAAARRTQAMEMSNIRHSPSGPGDATTSSPPSLFSEVAGIADDIQKLTDNVARISATRAHYLNSIDAAGQEDGDKLEALTVETRQLMQSIKERIQRLEREPAQQDAQIRRNQISLLRSKFLEALRSYQKIEREGDQKSKQRIERQLRIVKPDASPEDVDRFMGGSQQVFAQALTTSTRYGESRQAYREVQERQQDIRRMEQTLADLTQLFSDMGVLVEQQDNIIADVEATAQEVHENTGKALEHTEEAVIHARRYRKGRWICFGIFLAVCCILALVLGIVFGTRK